MIVGKPSTGKSHTAKAPAYQATLNGYVVRYQEEDTEFARYALAGSKDRANLLWEWVKPDLLIVDSLMHRCVMLEFEGKSYRLKEAATHLAIKKSSIATSNSCRSSDTVSPCKLMMQRRPKTRPTKMLSRSSNSMRAK